MSDTSTASTASFVLAEIFGQLRSKDAMIRDMAAADLRKAIVGLARDEPAGDQLKKYDQYINVQIFALISSAEVHQQLGGVAGVAALAQLISSKPENPNMVQMGFTIATEENTDCIMRFQAWLAMLVTSSNLTVMRAATAALGKLAIPGSPMTVRLVDTEMRRSLEWLINEKSGARRHAAVLILGSLAANAPALVYPHIREVLQNIWTGLRDPVVSTRRDSAVCLRHCLDIIYERDTELRNFWFAKLYNESLSVFKTGDPAEGPPEFVHASLLCYRELAIKGTSVLKPRIDEIYETAMGVRSHRAPEVRQEFTVVVPKLAHYDRVRFVDKYMHRVMLFYVSQLKAGNDRACILASIGDICAEARGNMFNYLEGIVLENIRDGLSSRSPAVRREMSNSCFYCLAKLAASLGAPLTKMINGYRLLPAMLKSPLTDSMLGCLHVFVECMPSLEPQISGQLLNTISCCLTGHEFVPPGSPDYKPQLSTQKAYEYRQHMLSRDGRGSFAHAAPPQLDVTQLAGLDKAGAYEDTDVMIVNQALKALGFFEFKGYRLAEFVQYCVVVYVGNSNPEVRLRACLTCTRIYSLSGITSEQSPNSLQAVDEVLGRLLAVCVSDPVSDVRLKVLASFGNSFDPFLAQQEHVRLLLMALHDEVFEVRKTAVVLVSRVSPSNAAYVLPPLRRYLVQLLTSLSHPAGSKRASEENSILLGLLIKNTHALTKPYLAPVMDALIPLAEEDSPSVSSAAITAVGHMAEAGKAEMEVYLPKIIPTLLKTFEGQSLSRKRDASLETMSQLISSSGCVIQPLVDYPPLLGLLVNILRSDLSAETRRATVRLLGILGALDPYKYREVESSKEGTITQQDAVVDVETLIGGNLSRSEDVYLTVAVSFLLRIMRDPSLSNKHYAASQALLHIFRQLGLQCVPFLEDVIGAMTYVIDTCPLVLRVGYLEELAEVIRIVKLNVRPVLDKVMDLVRRYFDIPDLQATLIGLIESVSFALQDEFRMHVLELVTMLVGVLRDDQSQEKASTISALNAFVVFGDKASPYTHLFVPQMVRLFENGPPNVRQASIKAVGHLCSEVDLADYASEIVHPLLRVLANSSNESLKGTAIKTICALMVQMGSDFVVFVRVVSSVLAANKLQYSRFDQLCDRLVRGEPVPSGIRIYSNEPENPNPVEREPPKLEVDPNMLQKAWDCSTMRTVEDWREWYMRLSIGLLTESPHPALRACATLATDYTPLAKGLFNCAFSSCWSSLDSGYKTRLAGALCTALSSQYSSPELHQSLLNLCEFIERENKAMPIRVTALGRYAERSHAYAKALHYKEMEFIEQASAGVVESLIRLNNQLQQTDTSIGILTYAQECQKGEINVFDHGVRLRPAVFKDRRLNTLQLEETGYEKLQQWDEALEAYNERERLAGEDTPADVIIGKLRCYHALGQWEELSEFADEKWSTAPDNLRRAIAPLGATACWTLGEWERMGSYTSIMKAESPDKAFFNAVLLLHGNNFAEAARQISKARDSLVTEITALSSESYTRAYGVIVRVQMLAELEEIITYKETGQESRARIRQTWNRRLLGCQRNVDVWQRVLKVRTLVVQPSQDKEIWIKFANLCRKSGRLPLAEKSFNLLQDDGGVKASPQVVYSQLKYMWACNSEAEALHRLVDFTSQLSRDLGVNESEAINQPLPTEVAGKVQSKEVLDKYTKLLARCYLKQGEWKIAMDPHWVENEASEILGSFLLATHFDSEWRKAWHNWALANFDVIPAEAKQLTDWENEGNGSQKTQQKHPGGLDLSTIIHYVVPAVKGFFRSIQYSKSSPLQDTLRLLTLWLNFGGVDEVASAVQEGFQSVRIDTWLDVIPQLISRIHQPDPTVSKSLLILLADLGKAHPQAMVYPLTVCIKSNSVSRQKAAITVLDKMRMHSASLVEEADLVANELIRVSVLWYEGWYDGLDDASRAYFGDHDVDKMFEVLEPLQRTLEAGPTTIRETTFNTAFGKDLRDAWQWMTSFRKSHDVAYLNQAWDLYYAVFRRISKQLPQLLVLDLRHVSPKLLAARDLELAIPGTYKPGKPFPRIGRFEPIFTVITSKQRPRKLHVRDTDGKRYQYLLKGHEDIRQDSLVMQLFGLVNTLLSSDGECFKRHLDIQRFAAVPLSPNAGLLGWVPDADTFHMLIKEYRDPDRTYLDKEHRMMMQMSPNYDTLVLLQKVECFMYSMEVTEGEDLYRIMWRKSKSSEAWLDRRLTYTRSLAVMSMVGYILGLGDRHPSNLMMDRQTGKVVHIDFGDCFESAILREKFPEKVPFRLTRMLCYAMGINGIEGSYRRSCENVMRVIRDNKESLLAILEAFAYDPLINWGFDFNLNGRLAATSGHSLPPANFNELFRQGQITHAELKRRAAEYEDEVRNARAAFVLSRITEKLTGNDLKHHKNLQVTDQVDLLIRQASSIENLCQHYIGWCAFW